MTVYMLILTLDIHTMWIGGVFSSWERAEERGESERKVRNYDYTIKSFLIDC